MSEYNYQLTNTGMQRINCNECSEAKLQANKNATIMFDNICEAEKYFKKEYGCYTTYFGYSTIIDGPLLEFTATVRDRLCDIVKPESRDNICYVHNKNTINLIFPHEQLRISGSKSFMNKFPFVKALIEGDFSKANFINYSYGEDFGVDSEVDCKEEITGSTSIIIENELESILLDKPITIRQKVWETKKWWKIEDVTIENLKELIIQFNTETHYNKKFSNNYYDDDDY